MKPLLFTLLLLLSATTANTVHADTDHPIRDPASGTMVATRLNPPPPPAPPVLWTTDAANGRCVGLEGALAYWSPGWDVARMSAIAFRESRCVPQASNSCCSGVLQIHRTWIDNVTMCGVFTRADLYDPWKAICAASVVWRAQGYGAWSTA